MTRNRERDLRSSALAAEAGYQVLRLWECEVVGDPAAAAARVAALATNQTKT